MANKYIDDLTSVSSLDGSEQLHIIQDGNSRRVLASLASRAGFMGAYLLCGSDQTCTNTTLGTEPLWQTVKYDTHSFFNSSSKGILKVPAGLGITHVRVNVSVFASSLATSNYAGLRLIGPREPWLRSGPHHYQVSGNAKIQMSASTGIVPSVDGDEYSSLVYTNDLSFVLQGQYCVFGIEVWGIE